ncbi:MAG: glycoside hydrolase family 6 protein [Actinomycetes bacterium]
MRRLRWGTGLVAALVAGAAALASGPASPLPSTTRFYVPAAPPGAVRQIADLRDRGELQSAALVASMVQTPQAVWLTAATPAAVTARVASVVARAGARGEVPTFVLYALPHLVCDRLAAPNDQESARYRAWVDAVVAGLARAGRVVVIVEPDSLALLPLDCPSGSPRGSAAEATRNAAAATRERVADLAYAARTISSVDSRAVVYLDAGHPGWRSADEMARRLRMAGVEAVRGFALNVANYQRVPDVERYGVAISACLAFARSGRDLDGCDAAAAEGNGGQLAATTPFVIDTSRSGSGPWAGGGHLPDPQEWCNPPGATVGPPPEAMPTTSSGLVDAYLWVKTPGESDGSCTRGHQGGEVDPIWAARTGASDFTDPPAGAWFPAQALELARGTAPTAGGLTAADGTGSVVAPCLTTGAKRVTGFSTCSGAKVNGW